MGIYSHGNLYEQKRTKRRRNYCIQNAVSCIKAKIGVYLLNRNGIWILNGRMSHWVELVAHTNRIHVYMQCEAAHTAVSRANKAKITVMPMEIYSKLSGFFYMFHSRNDWSVYVKRYQNICKMHATITTDSFHSNKSTFIPLHRQNVDATTNCTITTSGKEQKRVHSIWKCNQRPPYYGFIRGKVFVCGVCVCALCTNCEWKVTVGLRWQHHGEKKEPERTDVKATSISCSTQSLIFVCVSHNIIRQFISVSLCATFHIEIICSVKLLIFHCGILDSYPFEVFTRLQIIK